MKEKLISKSTAKLAKEKGFDEQHSDFYIDKTENGDFTDLPCVPQSILQKWLRDEHNMFVVVTPEFYKNGINHNVQIRTYDPDDEVLYSSITKTTGMFGDDGEFETYEIALEFGLVKALKLI